MSRRPERWTKQELKERLKTNGLKANDLWRGTFGGYLDLLISDPVKHYSTPAQLLYRGIYPEGSLENNFFSSGQHVLYGLDETLSLIHDFLWSAAQGYCHHFDLLTHSQNTVDRSAPYLIAQEIKAFTLFTKFSKFFLICFAVR